MSSGSIGQSYKVVVLPVATFLPTIERFRIATMATGWDDHTNWGGAGTLMTLYT